MYAIETFHLTKRFRRVDAVRDLNLRVEEGCVYALMGPNGAGKTTLIKMLMNLIGPTSGRATVLGTEAERLQGRRLERIGYVSENQKMPEWMTVGSFLEYWRPFYPQWDRGLEDRLVKRFDLPRKQKLKTLSRGVRMKAALASVLAYRPQLIVLDEPLSGLDPLVRDDLMDTLVAQADHTTVLFSSHDLAEIESFAGSVGYLDGGQLLLSETISSIRQRFRRIEAIAGVPLIPPESVPAEWQRFSISGLQAHWVESDFDAERSAARAKEVLGPVAIQSVPLTLRQVFLRMARGGRSIAGIGGAE